MNKEEALKKAQEVKSKIDKDFGKGTVMSLEDRPDMDIETISTGSLGLDAVLGVGGLPKGRIIEVYGAESCLSGDTKIRYNLWRKEGKLRNSKGGTLRTLFEKFNNLPLTKGIHKKNPLEGDYYTVQCINEDNRVTHNKIKEVVCNGFKDLYEVTLANGYTIQATINHKFYNGSRYVKLQDLSIGDTIHIHNNTNFSVDSHNSLYYKEIYVKYHPKWRNRIINNCIYFRSSVSRAIYEAYLNNLSYREYINLLNSQDKDRINRLSFIPEGYHIHHIDEDINNNDISNLCLISASEHGKLHAKERHNNLRFISVPQTIVNIEFINRAEVFDIRCEDPYHNYIANGFIVHNCGKTTLAIHTIAEAQKKGGICAIIDAEHAFDKEYATSLGVDMSMLDICQPDSGDQGLEVADRLMSSGAYSCIVIDSVAALVPQAELEGEMGESKMGLQARLMGQALRKMVGNIKKTNTLVIFINQQREKIGVMYGSPLTTSGGNALKFYASVRLEVTRSTTVANSVMDGDLKTGNLTTVKVIKSKVAPPFRNCEFDILYGIGIDKLGELVDIAVSLSIIKKAGTWFSYNDDIKIQGKEALKSLLADNLELYNEIYDLTRKSLIK